MESSPIPFPSNPRIRRALHHPILLLHRSLNTFHVLGSTSNIYTVFLSRTPTCSCPDPVIPCKHILFILLRVLRLPLSHPSLLRRSLPDSLLSSLLSSPTNPVSLANPRLLRRFQRLVLFPPTPNLITYRDLDGAICPICLEEMEDDVVIRCNVCGNGLHQECWRRWKRVRGRRRRASCVICRSIWRETQKYFNLDDVVSDQESSTICDPHVIE